MEIFLEVVERTLEVACIGAISAVLCLVILSGIRRSWSLLVFVSGSTSELGLFSTWLNG